MRQISNCLFALLVIVTAFCRLAVAEDAPAATEAIAPAKVDLGRPVDFERDIVPILEANCFACHNAAINESDLVLEDVAAMLKGGASGPAVVPGDAAKSLLFRVASRAEEPVMPPLPNDVEAKSLTPEQLELLKLWIEEGANKGTGGAGGQMNWQPIPSTLQAIYSVSLTPNGRWAAAGRANQIEIYDLALNRKVANAVDPQLAAIELDGQPMYPNGAAHRDLVNALAFSPDGNLLASGGYRVVKLWQRLQNVTRGSLKLPVGASSVAVSADGNQLAIGAANGEVRVIGLNPADKSIPEGEPRTLSGHSASVAGLEFTPDGATLYSSSLDGTVRAWNVADGAPVAQFPTPAPVRALSLGKEAKQLITGHNDNVLRVWTLPVDPQAAPAPALEIKGHGAPISGVVALPNGTQVLSGSEDGTARIWELADGKQTLSVDHAGPVTGIAARPDGGAFATVGPNGIARVWQATDGKQLVEMKGDVDTTEGVAKSIERQAIAKQRVALADSGVAAAEKNLTDRDAELKKAQEAKTAADKALTDAQPKEKEETDKVAAAKAELANKPDDAELKKKVEEAEKALTAATDAVKKATEGQISAGRAVELAQSALALANTGITDAKTRKEAEAKVLTDADAAVTAAQEQSTAAVQPLRSVAFSPDATVLATTSENGRVQLWHATSGRALESLQNHAVAAADLAFSGDGTLVSCADDGQVLAWDLNPGWQLVGQLGTTADQPLDLAASPFVGRVLALDFSEDGRFLATGGGDPSRSGELLIWNMADHTLAKNIVDAHSDTVMAVDFSRDGKYLLSGGADKFVKLFEVETGKHVRSFEGHTHHVLGVAWKADAATIASAGADNQIKVWNVETGEQRRTIGGYTKQVTSIQFVGTGENIVSAGGDKTVRFHKTDNGQNFRNFAGGADFMYSAAATRDESVVVAGGEDGVVRVWSGGDGKSVINFEPPKPADANTQANAAK